MNHVELFTTASSSYQQIIYNSFILKIIIDCYCELSLVCRKNAIRHCTYTQCEKQNCFLQVNTN